MSWLATGTFSLLLLGTSLFVYTLIANLEPQPEYPAVMTSAIRVLGGGIAIASALFGAVLFGYTILDLAGL